MTTIGISQDDWRYYKSEINDALTPTPEFYIARYPVTVAQFRAFVEATGFQIGDGDALRDSGSRPVRWVSWHEALAYCNWLNDVLKSSPALEAYEAARQVRSGQWRVALPSELEWEKAARGGLRNKILSWGDEPNPNLANYADTKLGDTCAVGCFPQNGFGIHDMIGNVWEWTRSLYLAYPYEPDDRKRENLDAGNDINRVVRGGSWVNDRGRARCAYRSRSQPVDRRHVIDFRVVVRSAPVP